MISYKSVLAEMGESITTKSVSKTEVRQIAETSIRSTISFMMMTAVTFFQIGQLQPGRPSLKDTTTGAKDFEKLLSLANNNVAVCPLYSNNIHSTDDSAVYFVSGINDKNECKWEITKNDGENNNVRSKYSTKQQSVLFGQTARLTWSMIADRTVAPVYVSFLGLSERELPKETFPSGVLVMPIQGLAVGGVDPSCTSVGYVTFVRAGKEAEKNNFKHYQQAVFRPYVSKKRNVSDDVSPTEADRAVSCSDGGGAQLGALLEEESIDAANSLLLTLCKHSASRTAAEQYANFFM
mmetsp:Transcript_55208/g.59818  ORF Transcript_55208/g.59818 Transcript_55208/m.59818 type:complete len:294 (-) Transcript_55208:21-902(-)